LNHHYPGQVGDNDEMLYCSLVPTIFPLYATKIAPSIGFPPNSSLFTPISCVAYGSFASILFTLDTGEFLPFLAPEDDRSRRRDTLNPAILRTGVSNWHCGIQICLLQHGYIHDVFFYQSASAKGRWGSCPDGYLQAA
jgi:hypothetical protein